ncbi:MAG: DNA polymerase III subunit [Planctomycetota bacterium]|jgi:DNA polymerase-3 subunit delta'
MFLKEIFCQDKAIGSLQRAYAAGRMAHAYIFAGDDGVGKFTTASGWAKMLLCENKRALSDDPAFVDSCGTCHSCKMFDAASHPDFRPLCKELVRFTKDGKNKKTPVKFPIDVIREFLIDKVSNRPTAGDFVVYSIDEFEKVSSAAQNALLKVLEEPPAYCVIILLCSRLDDLLPTTLSRCQLVRFGPVQESRIVERLTVEGVGETEAVFWARFSQGSLGRALAWATLEVAPSGVYALKRELVEKIAALELADAIDTAEWMGKTAKKIAAAWTEKLDTVSTTDINRRAQKGLIRMTACLFSDVMKLDSGQSDALVNLDQPGPVHVLAQKIDAETAARHVELCYRMHKWIDSSVNEKLIFEQLLLNLANSDILNVS